MKLVSTYWIKALLLFVLGTWPPMILAAQSVDPPPNEPSQTTRLEIRVAIDAWPPFRILDEDGYRGIDFDLWARLADELKLTVNYIRCPWIRCLKMMKEGNVDAMSGLALRPERAAYMDYVNPPYYRCSTVFYVRKGNLNISNYQDLHHIDVGIVSGSAYFPAFDNDTQINKINISTEKQLIEMLGRQRIPAIIGTDCQADFEITKSPYKDLFKKAEYRPENSVDLYFAISKKSDFRAKREALARALQLLLNAGAIDEIRSHYLATPTTAQKQ